MQPRRRIAVRAGAQRRRDFNMSFDFFNQNQGPPGGGLNLGPNGEESAWRTRCPISKHGVPTTTIDRLFVSSDG
jgi:hypothetical protein